MKRKTNKLSCKKLMHLPRELLSEILSWLDVDSLVRFKTVCKEWCSLIEDPTFLGRQILKSRGQWFFETLVDNGPATYDKYEYLDSSIGLLLERTYDPIISLRLMYPSTGKILELPDHGKYTPREMKMCHINSSDVLKLVVPYTDYGFDDRKSIRAFMVLTVGVDVTWREIDIPFRSSGYYFSMETVMIGEVYFMLWLSNLCPIEVICLEMGNEEISRIELPDHDGVYLDRHVAPLAWGENLAIGCVTWLQNREEEVHIWVLEDRKKNRWAEKEIAVPLKFVGPRAKRKMDLWASSEKGLLINCYPNEVVLLDVPSGKIKWRYDAPQGICLTGVPNLRRFTCPKRPHRWEDRWTPPGSPERFGDDADDFEDVPEEDVLEEDV